MTDLNFDDLEQAEPSAELSYKISNEDYYRLLELVRHTTYDAEQQLWVTLQIEACDTMDEFEAIRKNLLLNRIESKDRICMGLSYGMKDINNTIRHLSKEARKIKLIKL